MGGRDSNKLRAELLLSMTGCGSVRGTKRSIGTQVRVALSMNQQAHTRLARQLQTPGAVLLGLGSMVGTGVFVAIALGASLVGPGVVVAIVLAGWVALCNALSSAQLAAAHPVSGGTYEYGYRYLRAEFGFAAGVMFLLAKSASAAAAGQATAAYVAKVLGWPWLGDVLAPVLVGFVVAVVLVGLRRSNQLNAVIVGFVFLTLLVLCGVAAPEIEPEFLVGLGDLFTESTLGELGLATALLFVAFTGYGRVATLGEEVVAPRRTIPRAIVMTVFVVTGLYLVVAVASVGVLGAPGLAASMLESQAPLEDLALRVGGTGLMVWVAIAAGVAMLGVLLNLVLGLSRVMLAMARRGDAPQGLARIGGGEPRRAVVAVGVLILVLVLVFDVRSNWSFSAFTVLVYYAVTNLSALRLPKADRLYPSAFSWCGLLACLALAGFIEVKIMVLGTGLLVVALGLRLLVRAFMAR